MALKRAGDWSLCVLSFVYIDSRDLFFPITPARRHITRRGVPQSTDSIDLFRRPLVRNISIFWYSTRILLSLSLSLNPRPWRYLFYLPATYRPIGFAFSPGTRAIRVRRQFKRFFRQTFAGPTWTVEIVRSSRYDNSPSTRTFIGILQFYTLKTQVLKRQQKNSFLVPISNIVIYLTIKR